MAAFGCTQIGFQTIIDGSNVTFSEVNLVSGKIVQKATIPLQIWCIGLNPIDGFLYGVTNTANLIRIHSDYSYDNLGVVSNLPVANYNTGAIDENGYYYIYSVGATRYYTIDLTSNASPNYGKLVDPWNSFVLATNPNYGRTMSGSDTTLATYDWTYNPVDGKLYGGYTNDVYRLNPLTGVTERFLDLPGLPGGIKAAAWGYADGTVLLIDIDVDQLYKINFTAGNPTSATFFANAVPGLYMDGASCCLANLTIDYGDAPDTTAGNGPDNYTSLLANNGARHATLNSLYLGTTVTSENDAYQNAQANGDDQSKGVQDDGVSVPLNYLSLVATSYVLPVTVTNNVNSTANLYGWLDFNKDGIFAGNEASTTIPVIPSNSGSKVYNLSFTKPAGVTLSPDHTFVRIRVTTDTLTNTNVAQPTTIDTRSIGPASDGEVEDYYLTVGDPNVSLAKSAGTNFTNLGDTLTYTVTLTNSTSIPANNVFFRDEVPSNTTYANALTVTGSTYTGTDPQTGLTINTVAITLPVVIKWNVTVTNTLPTLITIVNFATIA
ncbi:MAG: DUF11 domain-containing protein, partial [Clostridium sp.]